MPFDDRVLGRTGLRVGALGIAASYGVPTAAVERAFEHGMNYLYWGSTRRSAFGAALRNLAPQRDRFVLVIQSYSRLASLMRWSLERALRSLKMDYADVLLLGLWNKPVSPRILDAARESQAAGLVRHIAASSHQRPLIPVFAAGGDLDVLHFRYNAAHTGAERDIFPRLPDMNRPGMVSFTATSWGRLLSQRRVPKGERVPTATDCYRFVLSRPEVDVCLTGPANSAHVEDAIAALRLGPMDQDELAWMRRVGAAVYGKRTVLLESGQ
jgi:aryl-alcohol dehydrogenase-like predicted oxidoreductase